jgi:hypothetical protein
VKNSEHSKLYSNELRKRINTKPSTQESAQEAGQSTLESKPRKIGELFKKNSLISSSNEQN